MMMKGGEGVKLAVVVWKNKRYIRAAELNRALRDEYGQGYRNIKSAVADFVLDRLTSGAPFAECVAVLNAPAALSEPDYLVDFSACRWLLRVLPVDRRDEVETELRAYFEGERYNKNGESVDLDYKAVCAYLRAAASNGRACAQQYWRERLKREGRAPVAFSKAFNSLADLDPNWTKPKTPIRFGSYGMQRGFYYAGPPLESKDETKDGGMADLW